LLGGIASFATSGALANAPLTSPRPVPRAPGISGRALPTAADLIAEAKLTGKLGYVVADARTGKVLEAHNPLLALPPASVTKAVTAVYGLDALGADFRFATRLIATGPVKNGRLEGDLVLAGGGDPNLDTDGLGEMAKALKAAGIREVAGKFRVYGNALPYQRAIDPDQPEHLGYNPAVSGLNLNFNRVHFEWKRASAGYTVTMQARGLKFRPEVRVARMRVVERDMPVYTYAAAGGVDKWTVAKSALGNGGSRWLPVRRPDLYAAETFRALARAYGIRLSDAVETKTPPSGTVLVAHPGARLDAVTRRMLKLSTNLTAEAIGLSASQARGAKPRTLAASARAMSAWMKTELNTQHAKFHDHSGLSDESRISASDMVKVLVNVGANGALHGLMKEIPALDEKGARLENARHQIHAKTGSLNFVSSLAGYVTSPDGRPLVFAIFTGDMPRRAKIRKADRERPQGARSWGRRSRWMQYQLINRWAGLYGT